MRCKASAKMIPSWRCWFWKLGLASWLAMCGVRATSGDCALAQIVPDGTLGAESSVVTPTNIDGLPTERIDGGATRGANLFHSFEQFSVPTGGAAYFNNALDIQNIISRVTGSSISNIDGLIQANGAANLFLLNPNGIIFGPNASLNIGGSFVGSTASSLNFADSTQFSATSSQTTPLLTVSVPIGLQYGGTVGGIQVRESILQVQTGQTLALMGGDVSVESGELGFLRAQGGRIEVGGLAGAGIVDIEGQQSEGVFRLSSLRLPDAVERGDVLLTNLAYLNVAGRAGGSIAINARNLEVLAGSNLVAGIRSGQGSVDSQAGDITLNATGAITVGQSSRIENDVNSNATGNSGNIDIKAGSLSVTDDAFLSSSTFGQGDAGSVLVQANNSVSLSYGTIYNNVESGGVGDTGGILIATESLSFTNGGQLQTSLVRASAPLPSGRGNTRGVSIDASNITFAGMTDGVASGIFSRVDSGAVGNVGNITIKTGALSLTSGARLVASTFGQGDAGNVTIEASGTVSFDGVGSGDGASTAAFSRVGEEAVGNAGDITIKAGSLSLTNGAQLVANTRGQGDAGNVAIDASDTVSFDGVGSNGFPSAAFSDVTGVGEGNGGGITIKARSLSLTDGAVITTSTRGQGNAGNIQISVSDSVRISGANSNRRSQFGTNATEGSGSGLFANTAPGSTGTGGNIFVDSPQLTITDSAGIIVQSQGRGNGGNLQIQASSVTLDRKASLSAEAVSSQGGNITLQSQNLLVLRRSSNISTTAGTARAGGNGGDITINTDLLVALEDSNISANAFEGRGGNIRITTQGLFLSPDSDITASSEQGINGVVEINNPDVDPAQGLATLPAQLVEASALIATGCAAGGKNEFTVTGRGGLPPRPSDTLSSDTVWTDLRPMTEQANNRPSSEEATQLTNSTPEQLMEAQGWVINDKGVVVLIATAPNVTPNIPWLTPASCHTPQKQPVLPAT